MVDTLSQTEIDALLTALQPSEDVAAMEETPDAAVSVTKDSSNDNNNASNDDVFNSLSGLSALTEESSTDSAEAKPRVKSKGKEKLYDFKRQTKFNRGQLNTLQLIHETFARHVGTYLSTRLTMGVTATMHTVTQQTFDDFIGSIFAPTFITIFRSDSLEGKAMLQIDLNIVFAILDRLLGGNGQPLSTLRQLTDVEKQIMQKTIMSNVLDLLRNGWNDIVDLSPTIEVVESNPQFAQIVPPSEVVVTILLEINIQDTTGNLKLCIPYSTVKSIAEKLNPINVGLPKPQGNNDANAELLEKQVACVALPVVAELGRAVYPLEDIVNLQVGDLIVTDQLAKNELSVRVGEQIKFLGRPGINKKKVAIRITKVLDPPGQEEE